MASTPSQSALGIPMLGMAFLIGVSLPASATVYDVSASGSWTTDTTWSPNIAGGPTESDSIVVIDPVSDHTVSLNGTTSPAYAVGSLSYDGAKNLTFQSSSASTTLNVTNNVTKDGSGQLQFVGSNPQFKMTIGGDLTVNEGTLALGLGTGFAGLTVAGKTTVASGASMAATLFMGFSALGETTLNGSLTLAGIYSNPSFTPNIDFKGLSGSGSISVPVDVSSARTSTLKFSQASGDYIYSGSISEGAVNLPIQLQHTGAGRQVLSGNTSYSGTTTINGGGVLEFAGTSTIGAANISISGGSSANGGSILGLGNGDLARTASSTAGNGNLQLSGYAGFAAYEADRTVTLNSGADLTWSAAGFLTGTSALVLGHSSATHKVTVTNNISFNGANREVMVHDGLGAIDGSLTGVLSDGAGARRLTKTGDGTLELTGVNTYSGGTTISAGRVVVNNESGSGTGSGAVTVFSGAVLGGTGTVSGAVSGAGVVDAGAAANMVGQLTFNSSLAVTGGMRFDLDGIAVAGISYDQIVATGQVTQGGVLTLDIGSGFLSALSVAGDRTAVLTLFTGESISGTFSSILLSGTDTNGFTGNTATGNFTGIEYTYNGDGTLTVVGPAVVPEPASSALLATLAVGAVTLLSRRQKRVRRE